MEPCIQNPRRAPRAPLRFPVEVTHGGRVRRVTTEDVGPGGCLLAGGDLPDRGLVDLVIHGGGRREVLVVEGTVVWARDGRAGVAFAASASGARPWFRRVMKAHPELAAALARIPDRLPLDAPLFVLPPHPDLHLTQDEVALMRTIEHGMRVGQLLARCAVPGGRAARSVFALLDKRVLTIAIGEAAEPWRWKAVLQRVPQPGPASRAEEAPPTALATAPAPGAPRLERPPALAAAAGVAAELQHLLRGTGEGGRTPEAQARLDEAREAVSQGQITTAVSLIRQALKLAPRDREIAQLLGQVAFAPRAA